MQISFSAKFKPIQLHPWRYAIMHILFAITTKCQAIFFMLNYFRSLQGQHGSLHVSLLYSANLCLKYLLLYWIVLYKIKILFYYMTWKKSITKNSNFTMTRLRYTVYQMLWVWHVIANKNLQQRNKCNFMHNRPLSSPYKHCVWQAQGVNSTYRY